MLLPVYGSGIEAAHVVMSSQSCGHAEHSSPNTSDFSVRPVRQNFGPTETEVPQNRGAAAAEAIRQSSPIDEQWTNVGFPELRRTPSQSA